MTFRTRLLAAFLLIALLPVAALTVIVRREMASRFTAQYERQVETLAGVIEDDLARQGTLIGQALARLGEALVDDNRFRQAVAGGGAADRRYLLDYAGTAMDLTGLSMLQIQDAAGRIASSGHFRNEYDRPEPALPGFLATYAAAPGAAALVEARAPDGPFLALARVDSFQVGGRLFTLVGGLAVDHSLLTRLARGSGLTVTLAYPNGLLSSSESEAAGTDTAPTPIATEAVPMTSPVAIDSIGVTAGTLVRTVPVPFIDALRGEVVPARFLVTHPQTELQALQRRLDRWLLVVGIVMGLLAVGIASAIAARMSRPLAELARKTERLDLERLDVDFRTTRRDEIGALSRLLGAMTDRLRAGAVRIKEAERRATIGDLARQVNHDIKNGLTPLRNVFRHLDQVASDEPAHLPVIFRERKATLDSSMAYLEDLAANYARLSPRGDRRPCDVNTIVRRVARDLHAPGTPTIWTELTPHALVHGDPVALRRIVENLVRNALDSLDAPHARVTVSTALVEDEPDRPLVRLTVADEGIGMTGEQIARAFDDFYTAKPGGTGLGLSIVRRLVMDLDGSIRVESTPGRGSRFLVDLPAGDRTNAHPS